MASVNKVILIGNLGKDPELRKTQNGDSVADFSLATTERFGGRDGGNMQEKTEWHKIVCWGKTAENVAKYLKKGRSVYVEGRLQTREWMGNDNVKRYSTEIVANTIQFLGAPEQSQRGGDSGSNQQRQFNPQQQPHQQQSFNSAPQQRQTFNPSRQNNIPEAFGGPAPTEDDVVF